MIARLVNIKVSNPLGIVLNSWTHKFALGKYFFHPRPSPASCKIFKNALVHSRF